MNSDTKLHAIEIASISYHFLYIFHLIDNIAMEIVIFIAEIKAITKQEIQLVAHQMLAVRIVIIAMVSIHLIQWNTIYDTMM